MPFGARRSASVWLWAGWNGKSLGSLDVTGSEYDYPSLLLLDWRLFLFAHEASQQGMVHVIGLNGKLSESSPLGKKMIYPQVAYDPSRGKGAVVYLDEFGQLKFQAVHHGP
jgi:hypothetical protein